MATQEHPPANGGVQNQPPATATPEPVRPARRRRRKLAIALVTILVVLVLLLAAAPTLLSTTPGKNFVLSLANGRLAGTLQLDTLSLSWFGSTRLHGLHVLDKEQRDVLNVSDVNVAKGLLGLAMGALNFGELRIESPRTVLYIGPDNSISLASALQSKEPAAPSAGPLPEPRGRIVVSNAAVSIVRDGAPGYDVTNVSADVRLDTLDQVKGDITAKLPDGATLSVSTDMQKLVAQGELRPAGAVGKCTLASNRPIQLTPLMHVLSPGQDIGGAVTANLEANGTGTELTVKGRAAADGLSIGSGEKAVREKHVDLELNAAVSPTQQRVSLTQMRLAADALSAELHGTITDYDKTCVCALQGRYDANWTTLTNLLHQFVPATVRVVTIEGKSTSAFEITGQLRAPAVQPAFRGVKAGLDVNWSSAQLYGVALGAAKLSPALKDGQLTIPPARIPAADGNMNVAGILDFQPVDPTLRIAESLQVFDRVALTPELASSVLSWINPIFLNLARIEGRVSLKSTGVELPLSAAIQTRAQGNGQLDLQSVRLQPAGWASEVTELAGLPSDNLMPVQFGQLDFVVRDGRIHYDKFAVKLPEQVDLNFHGSVGFDGTLDLVLAIPVRTTLLQRLGIKGGALDVIRPLSNAQIEIPLVGTREHPRLDMSKVDKESLTKQLLGGDSPGNQIEGLLRGLGGKSDDNKKKP